MTALSPFSVLSAALGAERVVWRQANKYKVPRIAFINKMDRVGADFFRVVGMLSDRLKTRPVVLQLPIGKEETFKGVVDLVNMNAVVWRDDSLGAKFDIVAIPADMADLVAEYREKLVEAAADFDEKLMEKYLAGSEATNEEIAAAVRKGA